jgi:hypothetical protein
VSQHSDANQQAAQQHGAPDHAASRPTLKPVRSRNGTIAVVTTERGLPTALKIDKSELARPPQDLAGEILALCQLSALRAQIAYQRELVNKGVSPTVIRELGLPTEEDLAKAEEELFAEDGDDEPPATWMRSV